MKNNSDLYDATIAAFSLMAFADLDMHKAELVRFLRNFEQTHSMIKSEAELTADIKEHVDTLSQNYERAKKAAIEKIIKFKDANYAEKILDDAQSVIISDNRITGAEESLLLELCDILGVSKDKYSISDV